MKKHFKKGFTIIEISLFLALSGFLMVGIIVGANASINRQRYIDSSNSFAEFIRGAYSDVLNVSNDKNPDIGDEQAGRTTTAIYGKFISFGEKDDGEDKIGDTVYVYDLVGRAVSSSSIKSSRVIEMMFDQDISANIFDKTTCEGTSGACLQFYRMTKYNIPWEGTVGASSDDGDNASVYKFKGAILIIRSPATGSIRTYTIDFSNTRATGYEAVAASGIDTNFHAQVTVAAVENFTNFLKVMASTGSNSNNGGENELTVCIDTDDNAGPNRRGLKISARANNSSGVMLTEMDAGDSKCLGKSNY